MCVRNWSSTCSVFICDYIKHQIYVCARRKLQLTVRAPAKMLQFNFAIIKWRLFSHTEVVNGHGVRHAHPSSHHPIAYDDQFWHERKLHRHSLQRCSIRRRRRNAFPLPWFVRLSNTFRGTNFLSHKMGQTFSRSEKCNNREFHCLLRNCLLAILSVDVELLAIAKCFLHFMWKLYDYYQKQFVFRTVFASESIRWSCEKLNGNCNDRALSFTCIAIQCSSTAWLDMIIRLNVRSENVINWTTCNSTNAKLSRNSFTPKSIGCSFERKASSVEVGGDGDGGRVNVLWCTNMINLRLINLLLIDSETGATVVYICKVWCARAWVVTEKDICCRKLNQRNGLNEYTYVSFCLATFLLVRLSPPLVSWPLSGIGSLWTWTCLLVCTYKSTILKFSTCALRITNPINTKRTQSTRKARMRISPFSNMEKRKNRKTKNQFRNEKEAT